MRRRSVRALPPSFALEFRRPFLEEGGDALLKIFRRTGHALHLLLEIELILKRVVRALPVQSSDQRQRDGWSISQFTRKFHGLVLQRRVDIDAIEQTTFLRP